MDGNGWIRLRDGIMRLPLAMNSDWGLQADIIRIGPNFTDRAHVHDDIEWVYVLEGSFTDAKGLHRAGDFLVNTTDEPHQVSTGAEGCRLLIVWSGSVTALKD